MYGRLREISFPLSKCRNIENTYSIQHFLAEGHLPGLTFLSNDLLSKKRILINCIFVHVKKFKIEFFNGTPFLVVDRFNMLHFKFVTHEIFPHKPWNVI